jgi:phosphonate C-P lyase system protein PhnG
MDRDRLIALGERCEATSSDVADHESATVGRLALDVLDPTAVTRFQLADVLVVQATVVRGEILGWSMRLGDDSRAAIAGAVCDAELQARGPLAAEIVELCKSTAAQQSQRRASQMSRLRTTEVVFE